MNEARIRALVADLRLQIDGQAESNDPTLEEICAELEEEVAS